MYKERMKAIRKYSKPNIHVVDMKVSQVLLDGSPNTATLRGYQYVEDGWD